jgi:hypothetical protein
MTKPMHDLSGRVFGNLTVLSRHGVTSDNRATWNCKCSCGVRKVIVGREMTNGRSISCGCITKRKISTRTSVTAGS